MSGEGDVPWATREEKPTPIGPLVAFRCRDCRAVSTYHEATTAESCPVCGFAGA